MHRTYTLLLTFFACCALLDSRAQNAFPISGQVKDTLNQITLGHASVVLIRAKDSILSTFTRSDSSGHFTSTPVAPGKYTLLITYPGFADYSEPVTLGNAPLQLGIIPLTSGSHLLQEFVLSKKSAAMIIRGDTTEYNADSFKVQSGANVEELMKRLPGLQVDKDGKITAQGEKVQKILVDGEEFFSDDPAVVTKNLAATSVDKVQVFDKKSDQTTFTGIDDGERTKTINLQLKEDKKRGVFGKAVASGGPSLSNESVHGGLFENQAMVNAFKGKRQLSAFGIVSNTGTVGLSWADNSKYGSSSSNGTYDEESGVFFIDNEDDDFSWSGRFDGEGLPTVWTGGLHYADKFNGDKQHISANYRYAKTDVQAEGVTTTQYILPDSGYSRNEKRNTYNTSVRNGLDVLYEWNKDTSSNLKFTAIGSSSQRSSDGVYNATTQSDGGTLINTSDRMSSSKSDIESLNSTLSYRKKFHKAGRNAGIEMRENYRSSDGDGYLRAGNKYYTDGLLTSIDSINQLKKNKGSSFSLNTRLNYTEPLSKKFFLTARYGFTIANNTSERLSFNRSGDDWNSTPDSLYSSSYRYDIFTQDGGLALRYVYKKYNISLGANAFHTEWTQHDRLYGGDQQRSYNNYAPSASLRYNVSKQSFFSINYTGSTSQPTLEQLQPLRQNTDPLNISVGNPDLRQEFKNSFRASYHSYKPLSGVYVYGGGGVTFVKDNISRSEQTDALGIRTYQYVNIASGNYSGYGWGGFGRKIKPLDLQTSLNGNISFNRDNNYVNGLLNTSRYNSYGLSAALSRTWQKAEKTVVDLSVEPGATYNDNHATIGVLSSYWSATLRSELFIQLPRKIAFRTDVTYDYRQKTEIFTTNNNVVRWNAALLRKFMKNDALEAKLSVRDILDQNIGYNRAATGNTITENRYNTIRRYLLASLTWNFAKGPNAKVQKSDDNDD